MVVRFGNRYRSGTEVLCIVDKSGNILSMLEGLVMVDAMLIKQYTITGDNGNITIEQIVPDAAVPSLSYENTTIFPGNIVSTNYTVNEGKFVVSSRKTGAERSFNRTRMSKNEKIRFDEIVDFLNYKGEKCRQEEAIYLREAYPDSLGMWIVNSYFMNGVLYMEAKCSDKNLEKREGKAVFYHYNGNVMATGKFSDGKRYGIWRDYDRSGNLRAEVAMKNNMKEGSCTYYHANGSVFGKVNYVNDKEEGESRWYYESGQLSEIATYKEGGEIIRKINYDENGNIIKEAEKDRNAEYLDVKNITPSNLRCSEKKELYYFSSLFVKTAALIILNMFHQVNLCLIKKH